MNKNTLRAFVLAACCICAARTWADTARVIVKYRENSSMLWQKNETSLRSILSARTGEHITASRSLGNRLQAVQADGIDDEGLIRILAAESDVEYALPDQFRTFHAITPNDQYFAGQWYLQATEHAAIDAVDAWTITTGSTDIVVAVLDTGILPNHPDLTANLIFSNGSVYGYDFITDPVIANDGDGRDADPSDPGDWVTGTDISNNSILATCPVRDSSWHGSLVGGVIGAASNNTIGIAGVAWNVRILPVRVLGKCGGYDSDIMAAMLWSSGISVAGVPDNQHPARIINLSLGSAGGCPSYYNDVIGQVADQGTLIVASAGNQGSSVGAPANCSGILAVSALSNTGSKTDYSNFGSEIAISAPGGNGCSHAFISALDTSTTSPDGNYGYTTCATGTSFAAPLVSGVAALMLATSPSLTPTELASLLRSSATTFPGITGLSACTSSATGVECNCTTSTCGAGMLNAKAAVLAARNSASSSSAGTATGGNDGGGGGGGGAIDPVDILLVLAACTAIYTGIRQRR